jgi:hypothetical protein
MVGDDVVVFIPALAPILLRAEQLKGAALTRDEVERIRDHASRVTVAPESAAQIERERGYRDLNPERCWQEWQHLRSTLTTADSA